MDPMTLESHAHQSKMMARELAEIIKALQGMQSEMANGGVLPLWEWQGPAQNLVNLSVRAACLAGYNGAAQMIVGK